MDTATAFAMGEANRGKPVMVFDWHKAARLIKETKPSTAEAGLSGDWEYTGGEIYNSEDGVIKDGYTYLASTWATPQIMLDGKTIDCYIMKKDSPGWDSDTTWPASAICILNEK